MTSGATSATGAAGRLAAAFIHSPLTPLFIAGSIALGALAVVALPREEEPQIVVPMVDVFVEMPGASAAEIEQRVTRPLEQLLWEIPGVEYLYSASSPGSSLVIVRFYVGENEPNALVRLNQKLASNADRIPAGVIGPLVKPRSIDDVPVMAVTLWGERYDDHALRLFAGELQGRVKEVADVSEVTIIGGRPRQVSVELDPQRLSAYGLDPLRRAAGHPVGERPRRRRRPGRRRLDHVAARRSQPRNRQRPRARGRRDAQRAGHPPRRRRHHHRRRRAAGELRQVPQPRRPRLQPSPSRSPSARAPTRSTSRAASSTSWRRSRARSCRPISRCRSPAITARPRPTNRTSCCGTCFWPCSRSRCSSGWRSASARPRSCCWPSR